MNMEELLKDKWNEILSFMRTEYTITEVAYKTWLLRLSVYSVEDDLLTIAIDDTKIPALIDFIKQKYSILIKTAIAEVTGQEFNLEFALLSELTTNTHSKRKTSHDPSLNDKYTFETFVVGSNNTLAHAAALAVAEYPAEVYNPLFIYGGVGLGKTHLMQAIAHEIKENDENKNVVYIPSNQFTIDLVNSIRNKTNEQFRQRYRNADVLLIDDIQFIINKEQTQEEFFHTFNALYESRKQIIISSDRPPKDMKTLEDRLRSRFEMGLIVDISAPDYETRLSILTEKNKDKLGVVSMDILEYIAENVTSNVRALSGALDKLIALSRLKKKDITMELAKEAILEYIEPDKGKTLSLPFIVDMVAEHYELTSDEIYSKNRTSRIAYARHIAIYLCKKYLDMSLTDIGKKFNRDHTTVMNSINRIEGEIKTNTELEDDVKAIIKKINPNQ